MNEALQAVCRLRNEAFKAGSNKQPLPECPLHMLWWVSHWYRMGAHRIKH